MKSYNIKNYIRYKEDLAQAIKRLDNKPWEEYTRDELIVKFLPLVENLSRKFSTAQQASGVMDITDLIQDGSRGLIAAVDKVVWETVLEAEDPEKRLKSFLSKRIKGAIRRAIDINRGTMRIPEHRINEMRRENSGDRKIIEEFFNSVFVSLDALTDDSNTTYDVPDNIKNYNPELLMVYLLNLLRVHLSQDEAQVVILSYGLNCDRMSAKAIARKLGIRGNSAYVRISQLKRQAIDKLIERVDYSQVIDFL
jgi:RNA polymerase sigma factor (sigma-70 family)